MSKISESVCRACISGSSSAVLFVLTLIFPAWAAEKNPIIAVPQLPNLRIVDYGADVGRGYYRGGDNWYQVEQVDVDGDGDNRDDSIAFVPYSLDEALNPSFPYYDVEACSAVFYGGLVMKYAGETRGIVNEGLINENHEMRDDFNFMAKKTAKNGGTEAYAVYVWKKDDFLNNGNRQQVSFDASSMIVAHISRFWDGMDEGRWVVRDGEQFYISQAAFGTDGDRSVYKTSCALRPTSTQWAVYKPQAPHAIAFAPATAEFAAHQFSNVTAVGFYIARNQLRFGSTGVKWHSFEVYANVANPDGASSLQEMVAVPAGAVSGTDEQVPAFSCGTTEVTYATWKRIWKWAVSSQYCFDLDQAGYVFDRDGDMGSMKLGAVSHSAQEPAVDMTWLDAVVWCNAFSEYEGRTPCYYADAACTQVLRRTRDRDDPANYNWRPSVHVRWASNGYRLPTMAEWGRAAQAGRSSPTDMNGAWIGKNASSQTHPVATRAANELGIFDLIGNVWEYCWDQAADANINTTTTSHSVLGGDFLFPNNPQENTPLPFGEQPWNGSPRIGFRVVRRTANAPVPPVQMPASDFVPQWRFSAETQIASLLTEPGKPELAFVDIPEGSYTRNADKAEVRISPFHMSTTEISYRSWNSVYLWARQAAYVFNADGDMGSMDHATEAQHAHSPDEPVTDMCWNDAALWCNALSEWMGKTPCYYTDEARTEVYRSSHPWRNAMSQKKDGYPTDAERETRLFVSWHANGYRLPTEAEWQRAYRHSLSVAIPKQYWWSQSSAENIGWLAGNSENRTHPVGKTVANPYGLFDMVGNVHEWVWDWPGYDYYRPANPKGGDDWALFGKVVKGSSFGNKEAVGANAYFQEIPGVPRSNIGFRIVHCDAAVHPESNEFTPATVLKIDPTLFDPLQGKIYRANTMRTGAFMAKPLREQGKMLWTFKTGARVRSSPVVVNGIVYVGSDDGHVYALDSKTGTLRWKFETKAPVVSSAAVVDDIVYIGASNKRLYALHAQTGEIKWTFSGANGGVDNAPLFAYGVVFAGFESYGSMGLCGIDAATGKDVWRYRFKGPNQGSYGASSDGRYICAPVGDIARMCASLATEYPVWELSAARSQTSMPIWNDMVYHYGNSDYDGRLYAYEIGSGKAIWNFNEKEPKSDRSVCSPAIADGIIYSGWRNGNIHAHDALDGTPKWSVQTGARVEGAPSVAGGVVYIGSDDAKLYVIDGASGEILWTFTTGGPVRTSPWPTDKAVFFGSDDGTVYALGGEK